jgi:hypothetical protein
MNIKREMVDVPPVIKKETSETIYSKTTMIINRLSNDALEGGWDLLAG